ncbi:MAG: hypothetical protein FWG85_02020 [Bacteroidetes bacterium]|nr:hypothetical protein [Bacteroidota bacterium]
MEILEYGEITICDANNFFKTSILLKDNISVSDLYKLSEGKKLIFNKDFPIPFFKIISEKTIIRGSLDTNRITIEFISKSKLLLEDELKEIFKQNF